ncbi:MAG: 2Fe-2S iron-sulfur cluster-binding protein, partial [bacterium]|nr:2Fe-2S iron-sulfur cluster-binding protein [bacterium]
MSNAERASSPNRMASQPNERIDRSSTLSFTFNDRVYQAHPGDTVGSALAAAGLRVLSRSFKYHRPRGLMCCAGQCPNCLVQIGDEPNVRSCMHPVEEGMAVRSQNAWPSLERDALSITGLAGPLMPVGFYYKTFIRPRALWPVYEHVLRNAAGLGKVDFSSIPGGFDKQYLHGGVAVVGAGPAGLSAALAAAEQGAQVLLFDENSEPGGHLRFQASGESDYADLRKAVETSDRIEFYRETTVVGWYKDHWLAAVRGTRLFKMRVQAVVVATGA